MDPCIQAVAQIALNFKYAITMNTILIPRWGGHATTDWYPEARQLNLIDEILEMPQPQMPRLEPWITTTYEMLRSRQLELSDTRIVTHSVGCHALMKALEMLPRSMQVAEVVMVAAWWDIDHVFWKSMGMNSADIAPWIGYPLDIKSVRSAIGTWRVIVGTEDLFWPDYQSNLQRWVEVSVDVASVLPKGKHFNQSHEPALFDLI